MGQGQKVSLHYANSLIECSLTSVEVSEKEVDGVGGVHTGVGDKRVFGAGRVKAPPPPGCCPGVAWQRKQVIHILSTKKQYGTCDCR